MHAYRATYWLINGQAYPDTARITATAGQRVLLRYVNTGYDNTTMLLLGMHERVLARDARPLQPPVRRERRDDPGGRDRGRDRDRAGRRAAERARLPALQPAAARHQRRPDRVSARTRHTGGRHADLHLTVTSGARR